MPCDPTPLPNGFALVCRRGAPREEDAILADIRRQRQANATHPEESAA